MSGRNGAHIHCREHIFTFLILKHCHVDEAV